MSKINPDLIRLFQVKVYKSIVNPTEEYLDKPINPANFRVSYSQNLAFNFELKNIRIRLEILLDGIDEKEQMVGIQGDFGIEFHFHIENFEEFHETKEGENKINIILGTTLLSIAFSTARGIILERTQNTLLNGILLPVIDPNTLIKGLPAKDETMKDLPHDL